MSHVLSICSIITHKNCPNVSSQFTFFLNLCKYNTTFFRDADSIFLLSNVLLFVFPCNSFVQERMEPHFVRLVCFQLQISKKYLAT